MRRFFLWALLLPTLGGALAAAPAPGEPTIRALEAARRYGYSPVRNSGETLFMSGRSSLRLTPAKSVCYIDGIKVFQCFPTRNKKDRPVVSRLDADKTFGPLSPRRAGVVRHRVVTITIDPGHGGTDRGAAGRTLIEKTATLLIAYRVATILRICGYRVYLTRTRDFFVPLAERCRIQKRHKSDLFVSIHVNAAARNDLHGIECFALTPAGAASTSGGPPSSRVLPGNRFDANNLLLAYRVQKSLLRRTGALDRGVKRARFAVLRDIAAPGILVEVGFLSNPREERLLLDSRYRERIARGIAEGIIAYRQEMLRR